MYIINKCAAHNALYCVYLLSLICNLSQTHNKKIIVICNFINTHLEVIKKKFSKFLLLLDTNGLSSHKLLEGTPISVPYYTTITSKTIKVITLLCVILIWKTIYSPLNDEELLCIISYISIYQTRKVKQTLFF